MLKIVRDIAEMACKAKSYGLARRDLDISARREPVARGRDYDPHQHLCGADRRAAGRATSSSEPTTEHLELLAAKAVCANQRIDISTPAARIRQVL
jgi:hypothetical protein